MGDRFETAEQAADKRRLTEFDLQCRREGAANIESDINCIEGELLRLLQEGSYNVVSVYFEAEENIEAYTKAAHDYREGIMQALGAIWTMSDRVKKEMKGITQLLVNGERDPADGSFGDKP